MALRIFLVEDSAAMRAHLASILVADAGVKVVGMAETEKQAINWLDAHADGWDVVLVDLFLREGTGAGVIEHCHHRPPSQKVFVMTNHARDDALLQHCQQLNADAVYHKATGLDMLVADCLALARPANAASAPEDNTY